MSKFETVNVTPALALEWLGNNEANRKPKEAKFTQYARDMEQGRWLFTGDPIRFAKPDQFGVERLIDGQNRLMAVVKSGRTVPFTIIRGLDNEAQAVIDTGAGRTLADQLTMNNHSMANHLATTGRLIFRIGRGADTFSNSREAATNLELMELIQANPAIEAAVMAVEGVNRNRGIRVPAAATAYYFGMFREPTMTAAFFEKLRSGVNLQDGEPVLALRNRIQNDRRLSTIQQLYLTLRMLNLTRAGQRISRIQLPTVKIGGQAILSAVQTLTAEKVNRTQLEEGE